MAPQLMSRIMAEYACSQMKARGAPDQCVWMFFIYWGVLCCITNLWSDEEENLHHKRTEDPDLKPQDRQVSHGWSWMQQEACVPFPLLCIGKYNAAECYINQYIYLLLLLALKLWFKLPSSSLFESTQHTAVKPNTGQPAATSEK